MNIQWTQIIFQILNFGLISFVLIKFLYHPISKVLEERSERIRAGMDAAEKNLSERERLQAEVKEELAKAKKEAGKIIAEAKKAAEVEAAAIIERAKEQAKKAADSERQAVETLIVEAKAKAEQEMKELVTATTAQVLKNGLSESDQRRIIESQATVIKNAKFN